MGSPHTVSLTTLITDAQSLEADDSPAMNEILRRFQGLAARVAQRLTNDTSLRGDLANAALYGLVRAVRKHDGRVEGFIAYASKYMRGAALRELARMVPDTDSDLFLVPFAEHQDEGATEEINDLIDLKLCPWGTGIIAMVIEDLTDGQRRIVTLRYVDDQPLAQIAAVTGTTVSAVSQRLSTIHCSVEVAIAA